MWRLSLITSGIALLQHKRQVVNMIEYNPDWHRIFNNSIDNHLYLINLSTAVFRVFMMILNYTIIIVKIVINS